MLVQLHHQFRDGHTDMQEQVDLGETVGSRKHQTWLTEALKRHPAPEGAVWMVCNEDSEHFVKCDPNSVTKEETEFHNGDLL